MAGHPDQVVGIRRGVILTFKPFSKLKGTFCKHLTSFKIKIRKTCVYKEYEIKIKMVYKGAMISAKNEQIFSL